MMGEELNLKQPLWFLKQTAIIPLHSINWFIFLMEAHIILWEIYTKSLYKMYINFSLQGVNYHTLQNYLTSELTGVVVVTLWES